MCSFKVAGELRKMVEFIKKEADEKAKEIELKVRVPLSVNPHPNLTFKSLVQ